MSESIRQDKEPDQRLRSVVRVSQVELEKEEETGKNRTRFFLHKKAMTTGSHNISIWMVYIKREFHSIQEDQLPPNQIIIQWSL